MAGYPDLIKTLEQLKSFLNDPRIAELDSCFDLTKRKNAKFRKKMFEGNLFIQMYTNVFEMFTNVFEIQILNHINYICSKMPAICNNFKFP